MAYPILLLGVVLLLVLVGGAAYVLGAASASKTPAHSGLLAERDAFIEDLRELAWQHRDVSPELSTIIIDEINTHHRRLPGAD